MKAKNKNRGVLDTNKNFVSKKETILVQNPVEKLNLHPNETIVSRRTNHLHFAKLFTSLLLIFLLCSSVFLNNYFKKKVDPVLYDFLKAKYNFAKTKFCSFKNKLTDLLTKPYVLTIGEYADFKSAKEGAINYLPVFGVIDIIKLENGIYTLELERFSSRTEAYTKANNIKNQKQLRINVRYIKSQ